LNRFEGENFVLDQQVVRSAVKSYNNYVAPSSRKSLAPSSYYLRLLQDPSLRPPAISKDTWSDSKTLILLLEWRAALLVREAVQTASAPDANIGQRVSRAVTEAFVAARVGDMIKNLGTDEHLGKEEKTVATKLYHLVVSLHFERVHRLMCIPLIIASPHSTRGWLN
jgi:acyl-CoA oxidase